MQEQRQNVENPSRKPETLGEGVVLDSIKAEGWIVGFDRAKTLEVMRSNPKYTISQEAALIDSRFAPLIEAAEDVVEHWEEPLSANAYVTFEKLVFTLRAAIAKAKGGAK